MSVAADPNHLLPADPPDRAALVAVVAAVVELVVEPVARLVAPPFRWGRPSWSPNLAEAVARLVHPSWIPSLQVWHRLHQECPSHHRLRADCPRHLVRPAVVPSCLDRRCRELEDCSSLWRLELVAVPRPVLAALRWDRQQNSRCCPIPERQECPMPVASLVVVAVVVVERRPSLVRRWSAAVVVRRPNRERRRSAVAVVRRPSRERRWWQVVAAVSAEMRRPNQEPRWWQVVAEGSAGKRRPNLERRWWQVAPSSMVVVDWPNPEGCPAAVQIHWEPPAVARPVVRPVADRLAARLPVEVAHPMVVP